uniref:KH domain-containing protein n=1 Tax=Steinernema glaseri TaxID=37863 RepID=A0A1I7ZSM3_9BILA
MGRTATKRSRSASDSSQHSRRSRDDNDNDVPKRKRTRSIARDDSHSECRLLVNVTKAGGIIGFKGQLIRETEEECNAKLTMSTDSQGGYRVLTIRATIREILTVIDRLYSTLTDETSSGPGRTEMIRIIYHDSIVAAVIGRGGRTVAHIRDKTNATINISAEAFEGSTDRVISVSGNRQHALDAIHEVLKVITGLAVRGSEDPFLGKRNTRPTSPCEPRRHREPARESAYRNDPAVARGRTFSTSRPGPARYPPHGGYPHEYFPAYPAPMDPSWMGHPPYGYPYPHPVMGYTQHGFMPVPPPYARGHEANDRDMRRPPAPPVPPYLPVQPSSASTAGGPSYSHDREAGVEYSPDGAPLVLGESPAKPAQQPRYAPEQDNEEEYDFRSPHYQVTKYC